MTIFQNHDIFRPANAGGMISEDIRAVLDFFGIVHPANANRRVLVPIMRDNMREEEIGMIQGDGIDSETFVIPGFYPNGEDDAPMEQQAPADRLQGIVRNGPPVHGLQAAFDAADVVNGTEGFSGLMNLGEEDRLEVFSSMAKKRKEQLVDVAAAYARKKGIRLVPKEVMKDILELNALSLERMQGPMSVVKGNWEEDPLTYMALMDQYSQIVALLYPNLAERIRGFSITFLRTVGNFDWREAAKFEKRIRAELHFKMFERKFDMHCGEMVPLNLEMLGVLTARRPGPGPGPGSGPGPGGGGDKGKKRAYKPIAEGVCRNWNVGIECLPACKERSWKHICQMSGCDEAHKSKDFHKKQRRED
jgi:hypothetical protein